MEFKMGRKKLFLLMYVSYLVGFLIGVVFGVWAA